MSVPWIAAALIPSSCSAGEKGSPTSGPASVVVRLVRAVHHFTNKDGFNAIRSQVDWPFWASTPPGDHPRGAYFTTLPPGTKNLAKRLGIPRRKTAYYFSFLGNGALLPLRGGRGRYVFYSPTDYTVTRDRQVSHGPNESA